MITSPLRKGHARRYECCAVPVLHSIVLEYRIVLACVRLSSEPGLTMMISGERRENYDYSCLLVYQLLMMPVSISPWPPYEYRVFGPRWWIIRRIIQRYHSHCVPEFKYVLNYRTVLEYISRGPAGGLGWN